MLSPYSFFGIGQIHKTGTGISSGMGGTGIAMPSDLSLNPMNPASYSRIDSLHFLFDFGFTVKQSLYNSSQTFGKHFDGMIRNVAIGFKPFKQIGISVGLRPYSTVNYSMKETEKAEGEIATVEKKFQGDGAINQFYYSSSIRLFRNFSAGINLSYFFGSINKSEISSSELFTESYCVQQNYYIRSFYVDYGLQYAFNTGKYMFSIGITTGNTKRLNTSSAAWFAVGTDTIKLSSESLTIGLPSHYGFGFLFGKINSFRIAADYEVSRFNGMTSNNPLLTITEGKRISVGTEFGLGEFFPGQSERKIRYRFGGFYQNSYMEIDGIPISWKGMTFGAGIPVKNNLSYINVSLEGGTFGTRKKNLIRESYLLLHLDLSLHDLWFQKRKFN
ncbi:MAG: hypothetical protein GYA22_14715 [Bacteroidales bacterium]|nr:hypothetical protein [Bacteroidales bacterium]